MLVRLESTWGGLPACLCRHGAVQAGGYGGAERAISGAPFCAPFIHRMWPGGRRLKASRGKYLSLA